MVDQIYPTELQLNKANSSDTEAPFLDLNLSITNGIVSSKIYDKRDDFNFEIVNFPFLDGDVPRSPSNGVYISQLIRFARVCSNVDDFNNRNLFLTAKLLKLHSLQLLIFFEIFYFLFKSFVKVELSHVFIINLFTMAKTARKSELSYNTRCVPLLLVIICVPPIIIDS